MADLTEEEYDALDEYYTQNPPPVDPAKNGTGFFTRRKAAAAGKTPAEMELERITQTPGVMGGKPCIRGMRVTVGMIAGQIGAGVSIEELLANYPYLEREDIMQALQYTATLV